MYKVLQGDVIEKLKEIESGTVHCCLTSPPYWALRDYGCDGQLGLEETPEEYIESMVGVFREVKRVLRDNGNFWINLGDSYNANYRCGGVDGASKKQVSNFGTVPFMATRARTVDGLKPKDLVGIPFRVAFALQADGWYLRSAIPWVRNSVMPEPVTDRPSSAIEYFFLLSKSPRYYYDIEAVKKKVASATVTRARSQNKASKRKDKGEAKWQGGLTPNQQDKYYDNITKNTGRNRRNSDWFFESIEDILNGVSGTFLHDEDGVPMAIFCNPQPYKGAHFATFAPRLITPMILASSSPRTCEVCGAPWERVVEDTGLQTEHGGLRKRADAPGAVVSETSVFRTGKIPIRETTGWQPTCICENKGEGKSIILDPFAGSGTTLWVAEHYGRDSIGIELNPEYCKLIHERMDNFQQTIFSAVDY